MSHVSCSVVQATQMDNSLRYALAKVEVTVMDINDNVPVFDYDMYNITVMENLPPGFTVVQVRAVDRDSVSRLCPLQTPKTNRFGFLRCTLLTRPSARSLERREKNLADINLSG